MLKKIIISIVLLILPASLSFAKDFGGIRPENRPCVANIIMNEDFDKPKIENLFGSEQIDHTEITKNKNKKIWWGYKGATVVTVNDKIKLIAFMRKSSENNILLKSNEGICIGDKGDNILKVNGLPTSIQKSSAKGMNVTMYMYNQIGKIANFLILDATNSVIAITFMSSDWYLL